MAVTEREALNRVRIARAALELTDEVGLPGLSMRKLGAALGVEAMSLYHHVANKDDLLDAVLEQLYLDIELPTHLPDDDWETAVRLGLKAFLDVLIGHPAALELFSMRPAPSTEAFDVLFWAFTRFQNVGLGLVEANHALHFAVSFVMGFAAAETGSMALMRSGKGGIDPADIDDPEVAASVREMQRVTGDEMFQSGLDAVVAGLRASYDLP